MKIAITGANGFVGSRLTRYLNKKGHQVLALIRPNANVSLMPVRCSVIDVNYQDESSLIQAFSETEIVIHSAALTKALCYNAMVETNVTLTERVVEAVNKSSSIQQLIFLSSQAAAGMGQKGKPKTEEDIPQPLTWYGKTKLIAEEVVKNRCLKEWTIVRPVSVYGPGDKDFLQAFKLMKNHLSISLGIRDKYISLIYIEELNQFIEKCLLNPKAFHQVFFASDGMTYTHRDFVSALQNAVHTFSIHLTVPDQLLFVAALFSDLQSKIKGKCEVINLQKFKELKGRYWTVSIEKARKLLEYNPQPNLSRNLHLTWLWYKEQGWL